MTSIPLTSTYGWVALDEQAIGKLVWQKLPLRPAEDSDVDIKNSTIYPCCIGHEIIGTVIRVGVKVTAFKLGERVGVGPQGFACLENDCVACGRGFAQRCPRFVQTHNGRWIDGESIVHGGLAMVHRAHMSTVIKIPEQIPSEYAAPMLCAGITSWAPLRRHSAGPGKSVGVIGVGGIGHFALIWAKALKCDKVVAIARNSLKKNDALGELGADEFIAMAEDTNWATRNAGSLDIIISTSDSADMPMEDLLGLLKLNGSFVTVGASTDSLRGINTYMLIASMVRIEGSFWGSYEEVQEMFEFAAAQDIRPKIQRHAMADANAVLVDQCKGKAKYKYVLVA